MLILRNSNTNCRSQKTAVAFKPFPYHSLTGERNSAAVFVSVSTTENNNFFQVLCVSCAKFIHQHNKSCVSGNFRCAPDKGIFAFASFLFFSLGLKRNTFNCKRSRLAKTVVEKHNTWSSCPSSCSQLYRLSVYLLFERDSYFGCENETTSSNSLPRLVGIFSLTDRLTGLVVQPLHGAMTIFYCKEKVSTNFAE